MKIIHCEGHKFVVRTKEIDGYIAHAGYICTECDLKVKTMAAAAELTGKAS